MFSLPARPFLAAARPGRWAAWCRSLDLGLAQAQALVLARLPGLGVARAWLLGLSLGLGGLLAAGAAQAEDALPLRMLAPGVYLAEARDAEEVGPDNRGRLGHAGVIVGPQGVLVVDLGTSYRHGRALLAGIARITPLPVRLAVVTHTRQEFLFGGAAFRERGIPVAMHRRAAGLMKARCEGCLKTLQAQLGEAEMAGTTMYEPDRLFDGSERLELIGRPVRIAYFDHSSGPGDIAVLDEHSGVLFAGGLLDNGRIPDVQDSRLGGWRDALAGLRALRPSLLVPGHGPPGDLGLIDRVESYLRELEQTLDRLLAAGVPLSEVAEQAELPAFAHWAQYETTHRRNASIVFLRLEHAALLR